MFGSSRSVAKQLPILLSVLSAIRNKFQFLISRQGDFAQCLIQYDFHKSVTFLLVIHDNLNSTSSQAILILTSSSSGFWIHISFSKRRDVSQLFAPLPCLFSLKNL